MTALRSQRPEAPDRVEEKRQRGTGTTMTRFASHSRAANAARVLAFGLGLVATIALAPRAAQALPIDVVFVVDDTAGMGDEIAALRSSLADFDATLASEGHDVAYGLVTFNETPTVRQDPVDLATFTAPGSPFLTFTLSSATVENGSLAVSAATTLSFRPGSLRRVILLSDEPDQGSLAERLAAQQDLLAVGAQLWAIVADIQTRTSYLDLVLSSGAIDEIGAPRIWIAGDGTAVSQLLFGHVPFVLAADAAAVPEPGTVGPLGAALALVGLGMRRRARGR